MQIPKFYRDLVKQVRAHGDKIGDGHAGWAAIADQWETYDIACELARENCHTKERAIALMAKAADEIVTNMQAIRRGILP